MKTMVAVLLLPITTTCLNRGPTLMMMKTTTRAIKTTTRSRLVLPRPYPRPFATTTSPREAWFSTMTCDRVLWWHRAPQQPCYLSILFFSGWWVEDRHSHLFAHSGSNYSAHHHHPSFTTTTPWFARTLQWAFRGGAGSETGDRGAAAVGMTDAAPPLRLRRLTEAAPDQELVWQFLLRAAHEPLPEGVEDENHHHHDSKMIWTDFVARQAPVLLRYAQDFGQRPGDVGYVAERDGRVVGAAWVRSWAGRPEGERGFAQVDDDILELAMAVHPDYTRQGIGTQLLQHLLQSLQQEQQHQQQKPDEQERPSSLPAAPRYTGVSLSVRSDNVAALQLYQRVGFVRLPERDAVNRVGGTSYVMLYSFPSNKSSESPPGGEGKILDQVQEESIPHEKSLKSAKDTPSTSSKDIEPSSLLRNVSVRALTNEDHSLMWTFNMLAMHSEEVETVQTNPIFAKYVLEFGQWPNDVGVVAELQDEATDTTTPVAAAWVRGWRGGLPNDHVQSPGFAYIADDIAELIIAVHPDFQHAGMGTLVLQQLLDRLRQHHADRLRGVCLSVLAENEPAKRLYRKCGFVRTPEYDGGYEAYQSMLLLFSNETTAGGVPEPRD